MARLSRRVSEVPTDQGIFNHAPRNVRRELDPEAEAVYEEILIDGMSHGNWWASTLDFLRWYVDYKETRGKGKGVELC